MAVKKVLRIGNPLLKTRCRSITEFDTSELHTLIQDMRDTMQAEQGAGLAAIQIGIPLRLVIFSVDANPRYPEAEPIPETVLINPVIEPVGTGMETDWEGCLSVPGLRGLVPRYQTIRYTGTDQYGQPIATTASGFHARVVQHEVDHLDGILYVERMQDMKSFGFVEELAAAGVFERQCIPCETSGE